ncbi:MAG: hypothetical protein JXX28_09725 [Deltaproteobacteria bacterium]|nr:hypothetical protein [Deltaproteobacteria bacterium]
MPLDAADPSFDRPFFSLLYATGLRLSEACFLVHTTRRLHLVAAEAIH